MNILVVTTIFPFPLNSGGAQAQFNMIDELRKKHNITILFNEDRKNRLSYMHELQKLWPDVFFIPYRYAWQLRNMKFVCNKLRRGFQTVFTPKSQKFLVDRALRPVSLYLSDHFIGFVNDVIKNRNIDVVQIEFLTAIQLVHYLPDNIKKVFIHHEIGFVKNARYLQSFDLTEREKEMYVDSREREINALNAFDTVVTLTQVDKDILRNNGVHTDIFVSPAAVNSEVHDYKKWNGNLVFVGSNAHAPNREGVEWLRTQVAPCLKHEYQMNIIGQGWNDNYTVEKLQVKTLGFVAELYDGMGGSVMLVPILSGSGMRMKILEAAACSLPIITTSVGVEGLDFKNRDSCLIADTPEEFAAAIEELTNSPELMEKIGRRANEVFMEKYTVSALADLRNKLYIK
jgi:glycosyltransferase involved in cell wall biosynthesis